MTYSVYLSDCLDFLRSYQGAPFDLIFLDPPFNQGKDYRLHDDRMDDAAYWQWLTDVCGFAYDHASDGAAIFFMQRDKNVARVGEILDQSSWTFQNLIVWKKMASATPNRMRFGKQHQIIYFATKGARPRVFNRLRIDLPLAPNQKQPRQNGVYVTDVWDDIRELTSGYFAGDEPLRDENGKRVHNQQAPVSLLARIILSSTMPGDTVFDPFAGTGTTLAVAEQLGRHSIGVEIDPVNLGYIEERLLSQRERERVAGLKEYYRFTQNLDKIWGTPPVIRACPYAYLEEEYAEDEIRSAATV